MTAAIPFDDCEQSGGKRQALAPILEPLHVAHLSRHDGADHALPSERLSQGMIVARRKDYRSGPSRPMADARRGGKCGLLDLQEDRLRIDLYDKASLEVENNARVLVSHIFQEKAIHPLIFRA